MKDKKDQRRRRRSISAPPERELEHKLKRNPDDLDAKADVGSDESMDASDPPSADPARAEGRAGRRRRVFPNKLR